MEYKYEQIFGDQSLFDGAPEDAEAVGGGKPLQDALVFYKFSDGEFQYKYEAEIDDWKVSTCKHPQSVIKAMRRIIKVPVWKKADKLAGKLPEVGCKAVQIQGFCEVDVLMIHNGCVVVCNSEISDSRPAVFKIDSFMELYTPIETPAEKARRERDEWAKKASEFIDDELDCVNLVGEHVMRRFYNAMLSGELPMPKKGGE